MKKIYNAALEVSQKHPDLTIADALNIMDQSTTKEGNPYRTRIENFLSTSLGKWYAEMKGSSAPQGSTAQAIKPSKPAAPEPPAMKEPKLTPVKSLPQQSTAPVKKPNESSVGTAKDLDVASANALQEAMNAETPPPWTKEQRESIRFYTNGPYRELNGCLRGHSPCTPELTKHINVLKSVMKPSTEDVVLYRGADPRVFGLDRKKFVLNNPEGIKILQKLTGKTLHDKGVISTSIDNITWSSPFQIKIEAPKGTKMAWVQSVSGHKDEKEIMLAPNTRFEVVSAKKRTFGGYDVHLRVVVDEE